MQLVSKTQCRFGGPNRRLRSKFCCNVGEPKDAEFKWIDDYSKDAVFLGRTLEKFPGLQTQRSAFD